MKKVFVLCDISDGEEKPLNVFSTRKAMDDHILNDLFDELELAEMADDEKELELESMFYENLSFIEMDVIDGK